MNKAEKVKKWREDNPEKFKAQYDRANKKKKEQQYYQKNKEVIFENYLKRTYDINLEHYNTLSEKQGGVCAICNQECVSGRRLAVDHNHDTGEVRGLLCCMCNRGLGNLGDNLDRLRAAVLYLEKYQ